MTSFSVTDEVRQLLALYDLKDFSSDPETILGSVNIGGRQYNVKSGWVLNGGSVNKDYLFCVHLTPDQPTKRKPWKSYYLSGTRWDVVRNLKSTISDISSKARRCEEVRRITDKAKGNGVVAFLEKAKSEPVCKFAKYTRRLSGITLLDIESTNSPEQGLLFQVSAVLNEDKMVQLLRLLGCKDGADLEIH